MPPGSNEIELKLHAAPNDLARLREHPVLARYRSEPPRTRRMATTYFDTPDYGLARGGIALRVRRIGDRHIQAVKARARAPVGESAGAAVRREWEWPLDGDGTDLGLLDGLGIAALQDAAALKRLAPIFTTDIERTSIDIAPDPATRIEVSFDSGTLRTASTDAPISEVELELVPPTAADRVGLLYEIALALHEVAPLRIGTDSKADLGYALLGANPARPRKATPAEVAPELRLGEAFARIAGASIAHMLDNQRCVLEEGDAEGIRQMRIALRRLRAAIALFAPLLGRDGAPLKREVKWLAGALSAARDWDVLAAETLERQRRVAGLARSVALVLPQVEAAREAAHREAAAALRSARYTALVLELGRWIEARRHAAGGARGERVPLLGEAVPALLDRRAKKLRRAGKGIAHLTVEERHALRKSLKAMRYAAAFLAPLYRPHETKRYLRALGRMQDRLGAANDLVVAEALASRLEAEAGPPAATAWPRLRRWIRARHAARLAGIPAAWKRRLRKAEPFWRRA